MMLCDCDHFIQETYHHPDKAKEEDSLVTLMHSSSLSYPLSTLEMLEIPVNNGDVVGLQIKPKDLNTAFIVDKSVTCALWQLLRIRRFFAVAASFCGGRDFYL